jgi:anti-anti-sigma factor
MAPPDLRVGVRHENGQAVIDMAGELNAAAGSELDAAYSRAVSTRPSVVVLDFGRTQYMNSTGIALIVSLFGKARSSGMEVRAVGLSQHYREIFEVTRLSDFITILDPDTDPRRVPAGADRSSHA